MGAAARAFCDLNFNRGPFYMALLMRLNIIQTAAIYLTLVSLYICYLLVTYSV